MIFDILFHKTYHFATHRTDLPLYRGAGVCGLTRLGIKDS